MPSFGSKPSKKETTEKKAISSNNKKATSNLNNKSPEVNKAIHDVMKIEVKLDNTKVERYLVDELDIPDDPVKINKAIMKHSSRQALYGMLHNIAKSNHKDLIKQKNNAEKEKENYIKKKKQKITEELYDDHKMKGLKKPNKDQIQDAVDIYTDDKIEKLDKKIDGLEENIAEAEKLKNDLWVTYDAFRAQKDDLITLSSNWRHDSDLFKGLSKHKK